MFLGLVKAPGQELNIHLLWWTQAEQNDRGSDPRHSPVDPVDVDDRNHFREADHQKRNGTGKVVKKG